MANDLLSLIKPDIELEVIISKNEKWMDISQEIKDIHFPALEIKLQKLEKIQNQSIIVAFDEEQDDTHVTKLRNEISKEIRTLYNSVKTIGQEQTKDIAGRDSIVKFLTTKLQKYLNQFTILQSNHADKLSHLESLIPAQETQMLKQTVDVNNQRHQELTKLLKEITELHQLYQDFALLVDKQGEILDVIDTNVNNSIVNLEESNIELRDASKNQKRFRSKLFYICCMILYFIICILISILVVT